MADRPQRAEVTLVEGARMRARVGDVECGFDFPERLGGQNTAPTPTECFVSSIAACELFFAYRFLERRGVATDGATATVTWESTPRAIHKIKVELKIPGGVEGKLAEGCLKMARSCFVTQSVEGDIEVETTVS